MHHPGRNIATVFRDNGCGRGGQVLDKHGVHRPVKGLEEKQLSKLTLYHVALRVVSISGLDWWRRLEGGAYTVAENNKGESQVEVSTVSVNAISLRSTQ